MPSKKIQITDLGNVTFNKRRNSRSIRISLGHNGEVKVSFPRWVTYFEAERFVKSKAEWIKKHRSTEDYLLKNDQKVGKYHILKIVLAEDNSRITSRVYPNEVLIKYPPGKSTGDEDVQKSARRASNKALQTEAELYLPERLKTLSEEHHLKYSKLTIRRLKSRWGSCSSLRVITLNSQLMLLPWQLIDYVIMHELIHTKVMKHGPEFWKEFTAYQKDALILRKEIKAHKPVI